MNIFSLFKAIEADFQQQRVASAALDARLLVCAGLEIDHAGFIAHPETPVPPDKLAIIKRWAGRRMAGEPISRILGAREFWGMPFVITPDTLDPRPDSEVLVERALSFAKTSPVRRILDLGTGTGCLLLAILKELPEARGVGVDLNPGAVDVSRENAAKLGLSDRAEFIQGDWFAPLDEGERFDMIISNPPYIPEKDVESLAKEVRNHDPILALSPGPEGLEAYKIIFSRLKNHLNPGGLALFEIGFGQEKDVTRLVDDSHMFLSRITPDLAGIPRVVEISNGEN